MKIIYFDCFAGASGDMILGSLLDAGLPFDTLKGELAKLPFDGYSLAVQKARRGAIEGTHFKVTLDPDKHGHHHRRFTDIRDLIEQSTLSGKIKSQAVAIFRRLAEAEAKVHGTGIEEVHFHEVGAVDAIVDIVGAVIGLDFLGIEDVYSSPFPSGGGTVKSAHGIIPVPAPATVELLAMAGAPMVPSPTEDSAKVEMVTPTGAAIISTLARGFSQPTLSLQRVGYGVGTRQLPILPNVLRVMIGERAVNKTGQLLLLETNIDDMNAEFFGYVMERLFSVGARDVWFTPIQMKKNRPATMLSVITLAKDEPFVTDVILRETSTLGIRCQPIQRHEAERESFDFASSLGSASVKVKRFDGRVVGIAPEFEICRNLALEKNLPLQEVYRIVSEEARRELMKPAED